MASPLWLLRRAETHALRALDHLDERQDGIGVVLSVCERSGDEAWHRYPMLLREGFRITHRRSGQSDTKSAAVNAEVSGLPVALAG